MSELQPFLYGSQEVRTIFEGGNLWFVAADVARVLGYSATSAMTRRIDPDEKGVRDLHTLGGIQSMAVISEPGVYEAVFGSQVEGAQEFKRWVKREVLPQIRKTGSYSVGMDLTSLDSISAILDAGKAALNRAQAAETRVLQLEGPAAEREFFRNAQGQQLVGDVANRFISYARDRFPTVKVTHSLVREHAARLGIIIRGNTVRNNQPTAQAIRAGWATASEHTYEDRAEVLHRTTTTRLTPKGEGRLWDGLCAYAIEWGTLELNEFTLEAA